MANISQKDNFTMVYQSILYSSIAENYELRHFFEDMLKLADWRTGIVDMTPSAISRIINLPEDKVLGFIAMLEEPDKEDKSGMFEGRRIIRLDEHRTWGWTIVNYKCYRATKSEEERREYNRLKQAEYRAARKGVGVTVTTQTLPKLPNGVGPPAEPELPKPVAKQIFAEMRAAASGHPAVAEEPPADSQPPPRRTKEPVKCHPDARAALFFLNEKSGFHYREADGNLKIISARLCEPGVTIEGVKQMIGRQCAEWQGTEMAKYLRPLTLFRPEKFDGYYGQKDKPVVRPASQEPPDDEPRGANWLVEQAQQ